MSQLRSPAPTLAELRKHLKALHTTLQPVLGSPLEVLTTQLEQHEKRLESSGSASTGGRVVLSGRLESAQLQSSITYVLLDLIWVLLKLHGTDPASHPVSGELSRVQQYLTKLHNVDRNIVAAHHGTAQARTERDAPPVDKQKASRFINAALGPGASATGKRTIFAEDGTVQSVVSASDLSNAAHKDTVDSTDVMQTDDVNEESGDTSDEVEEESSDKKGRSAAKRLKEAQRKASDKIRTSDDAKRASKATKRQK